MLCVQRRMPPRQELASFATIKTNALLVTPESGLVLVGTSVTPPLVETKFLIALMQITESNTLKPWDTYCAIKRNRVCVHESDFSDSEP